ncbi:uncharacterized protein LOC129775933 [Toxorhynchites rutilus septentrionalis]|uniref:uncharacterized protein LOC129775933 n=1 Tax=Toxorhynchites rutilus septentrionalis TaxID=329112 RepID=UPI00247846C9|nr:uncharacterized protein LOC129775933 [Toxorhynchites rutilus septentrionalis]
MSELDSESSNSCSEEDDGSVQSGSKSFTCKECDKEFRLKSTYDRHISTNHKSKVYHCKHCDAVFLQYTKLLAHCKLKHYDRYHLECSVCKKRYQHNQHLRRHWSMEHQATHGPYIEPGAELLKMLEIKTEDEAENEAATNEKHDFSVDQIYIKTEFECTSTQLLETEVGEKSVDKETPEKRESNRFGATDNNFEDHGNVGREQDCINDAPGNSNVRDWLAAQTETRGRQKHRRNSTVSDVSKRSSPGPGSSDMSLKCRKRRSGGATKGEIASRFIKRDGDRGICNMDNELGNTCTYVQRKLDINNFIRHFRTQHPERAYIEGLQMEGELVPKKPRIISKRLCAIDKSLLIEASIKLVTNHYLPVSCVEWEAMRMIFDPLTVAVGMTMDTRNLECHLKLSARKIKDTIVSEMKGCLISLKIDSVSRHNRHVLTISARYAIEDKIATRTLGIIEVKLGQTTAFVKDQIMSMIGNYGLTSDQIFSVTCDNGANMLGAVRKLKQEFEADLTETNIQSDEDHREQQESFTASLSDQLQKHFNIIRCAVHALQLAISDVVNKFNEGVQKLADVARKCKSVKYTKFFERHCASYPPVWGQTSWDGIYLMISKFLEQRSFFDKLAKQFQELDLSDSWNFAEQYEAAFKPLYTLTEDMQTEHVFLSDFYLQWIVATQKVKKTEPNLFAGELVANMNNRLQNLRSSRAFKMALYLDPRLNFAGSKLFTHEEKEEIQGYIADTWKAIQGIRFPKSKSCDLPTSSVEEDENDTFITQLFGGSTATKSTGQETGFLQQLKAVDVEPRRSFNFDVWRFWLGRKETHPELSAVASVVLATPSNQMSIECAFSALEQIVTNSRSTLWEDTLQYLLLVKLNSEIFDKILSAVCREGVQ